MQQICGAALIPLLISITTQARAQAPLTTSAVYPTRYVAATGQRAMLGGNSAAGLEGWAYPLQLVRGLKPAFLIAGSSSAIPADKLLQTIQYAPTFVERTYVSPEFTVHERIFIPVDLPGGLITYTIDSKESVSVVLSFVPVMDLMWPVGTGGQEIHWKDEARNYEMEEPTGRFHALLGSPDANAHDNVKNTGAPVDAETRLTLTLRPARKVRFIMAADTRGLKETREVYANLLGNAKEIELQADRREQLRAAAAMQIQTPDKEVNEALAWSQLAINQAWACNSTLGCGLVAGYGPSRGLARRPQYDWFFAGDAMITIRSLLLTGDFDRAREALLFLMKYQDASNGMMWHEMSQSAGYVNWARDYPYMFPHVELTFRFLVEMEMYAKATGDTSLLQEHWQNIANAYRYCSSLIDPGDGLPKVPAGKEGDDEQGHPREELALAVDWMEAAEAFANLAVTTGRADVAVQPGEAAARAKAMIPSHFWSEKEGFWQSGIEADGKGQDQMRVPPTASLNLLTPERLSRLLNRLSGPEFETPWGTRGTGSGSKGYDPLSYGTGSVWATASATVAEELWQSGRSEDAWRIWRTQLPWLTLDAMGHMHETLSGNSFTPQVESVPEQTWSSAMLVSSFVGGVLGLEPDAERHHVTIAPHLPREWKAVSLKRIRVGKTSLDLDLLQARGSMESKLRSSRDTVDVTFVWELPDEAKLTAVLVDGRKAMTSVSQQGRRVSIPVQCKAGDHKVTVQFKEKS